MSGTTNPLTAQATYGYTFTPNTYDGTNSATGNTGLDKFSNQKGVIKYSETKSTVTGQSIYTAAAPFGAEWYQPKYQRNGYYVNQWRFEPGMSVKAAHYD